MSELDDLRKRLARLNRGPLPPREKAPAGEEAAPGQGPAAIVYSRDLPRRPPPGGEAGRQPGEAELPHPREPVPLSAAGGCDVAAPEGGKAHLITSRIDRPDQRAALLGRTLEQALADPVSNLRRRIARECLPHGRLMRDLRPEDVLFLDVETTGLAGSPVFLIGSMELAGGALLARQYFAADYSQERAILRLFLRSAEDKRLLVSFNGKSFDLPLLRVRAAASAVPFTIDPAHFDLLHLGRRIWGRSVPDCRLQTLETFICGRSRGGDIPGHLIPEAYHAFVRTGDARQMLTVIRHNLLDLVTLADLLVRLPAGPRP